MVKYLHSMIRVTDPQATVDFFKLIGLDEVRRFDVEAGRFIEEKVDSRTAVELTPGKRVTLLSHVTRRLSRAEERVVEPEKPGEYLFYFEADDAHPIVVAGKRVGKLVTSTR